MAQKSFDGKMTYEQIISVFKMLLIPKEILQKYLFALNSNVLKSEFRKMALQIHPDKNKHPKAALAFQKINSIYRLALERWE